MRLDKYLSGGLGLGSRSDVKKMIKKGRVRVDGIETPKPDTNFDPESTNVYVDGVLQNYKKFVYLMLNKPKGYISATQDKKFPVVTEFVPSEFKHLEPFPVGRLDIDTEGLCVLTNDGAMSHRLLSPRSHVPKTYFAEINTAVTDEDVEIFKAGVILDDGYKCKPSELTVIDENKVQVVIYEGKFHQIKRMFEALGKYVTFLKRIKMNNLILDQSLEPGDIRELTEDELKLLNGEKLIYE